MSGAHVICNLVGLGVFFFFNEPFFAREAGSSLLVFELFLLDSDSELLFLVELLCLVELLFELFLVRKLACFGGSAIAKGGQMRGSGSGSVQSHIASLSKILSLLSLILSHSHNLSHSSL